jgi:hypothetical protein
MIVILAQAASSAIGKLTGKACRIDLAPGIRPFYMLYSFLNNKQEYPLEETFTRLDMPSGEGEKWRVARVLQKIGTQFFSE